MNDSYGTRIMYGPRYRGSAHVGYMRASFHVGRFIPANFDTDREKANECANRRDKEESCDFVTEREKEEYEEEREKESGRERLSQVMRHELSKMKNDDAEKTIMRNLEALFWSRIFRWIRAYYFFRSINPQPEFFFISRQCATIYGWFMDFLGFAISRNVISLP